MKSILSILTLTVLFGCATTNTQSNFSADTVNQIKVGMTKGDVTSFLGEPRSRSVESDGTETWQYRKNGQQGKGLKTYSDIASFGLTSGQDAEYQDILTVFFKDGVVAKSSYQENVHMLLIK